MNYALIIKLEYAIHETRDSCLIASAKKTGKSLGIIHGNTEKECTEKIEHILKMHNLKVIEAKS